MDPAAGDRASPCGAIPPGLTFALPELPPFAIERPRLTRLLDVTGRQPLTVVVAPPGYGKTVLLTQWVRSRRRPPARWITLGPEHDDPAVLLDHLRTALTTSGRGVPGDVAAAGRRFGAEAFAVVAAEMARLPPTTLVLDDVHHLSSPAALDVVAELLDHAPKCLRVVAATRADLPLPLYRLRDHGVSFQLRQEDLAFTRGETAELLRRLVHVDLPGPQIDALVERTEGWPAGLQLVALALPQRARIDDFVAEFADDDRAVADYLTEQVLDDLPAHLRGFLASTCELDRMSGPLCDFVRQRTDSRSALEELERRSMFVTTIGGERTWFRYHRLFRAYLRSHLADAGTHSRTEILVRAAEWHLRLDDVDTAVGYLAAAGRWNQVLDLASSAGATLFEYGDTSAVAGWFAMVPAGARHPRVAVAIDEAAALLSCGRLLEVQPVLVDAAEHASRAERPVLELIGAWRALRMGQLGSALEGSGRAASGASALDDGATVPSALGLVSDPADVAAAASIVRGAALVHLGSFAEARDSLRSNLDGLHDRWQMLALGSLALLDAWSGHLDRAEQHAHRLLHLGEQLGRDSDPSAVDAMLALAVVARSRGRFDAARHLLDLASSAVQPGDGVLRAANVVNERALLAVAEGDPASGLAALAARPSGGARGVSAPVSGRSAAVEADVFLANGDLERAARALSAAPSEAPDALSARVRLELARGDRTAARSLAGGWPEDPSSKELEQLLAAAVVEHLSGERRAAEQHMDEVVRLAELDGNVGIFHWQEARSLARSRYRATPTPFLRSVVELPPPSSRSMVVGELVEQLTDREHLLLQLLPTRMANSDMAESMGISLNTVKTHLKHIYRKLGVEHRRDAIAAAERLGLL